MRQWINPHENNRHKALLENDFHPNSFEHQVPIILTNSTLFLNCSSSIDTIEPVSSGNENYKQQRFKELCRVSAEPIEENHAPSHRTTPNTTKRQHTTRNELSPVCKTNRQ